MAQYFSIHPKDPQRRLIRRAVEIVRDGGLMVYPTDSCYALGCHIGDKAAMARIRRIRQLDEHHHFTLVCRDLSELGQYAIVDNIQFRSLKASTPGSYTFILKATREVPKRLLNPRRHTIGVRVPDHAVVRALLE
ncbi:MAG: L-threonylcarbamoyladenylate synthase, partial [Bryobacteraceae bacterium]